MSTRIGLDYGSCSPTSPTLLELLLRQCGPYSPFDFAVAPLFPAGPGGCALGAREAPLQSTSSWHSRLVGSLSSVSEGALRTEYGWACHLGLQCTLAPAPAAAASLDAARALYGALLAEDGPMLCLRVGLCEDGEEDARTWRAWNALRTQCSHTLQLGLCLEVGAALPCANACARWAAEPVRLAMLPTSLFSLNTQGFPILPRAHCALVQALLGAGVALCVSGPVQPALAASLQGALQAHREGSLAGDGDSLMAMAASPLLAYCAYLRHLAQQRPAPSAYEAELAQWEHTLMSPLQPLAHNLPSGTYEVFERDAPKYAFYERAIALALQQVVAAAVGGAADAQAAGQRLRVLVIGAGRGPLVECTLRASRSSDVPVAITALEKNPNAFRQLQGRGLLHKDWQECVQLELVDVRDFAASSSSRYHILVSELLGSFGDNELSPECLECALPLLEAGCGVCIPASYTSYLVPLTCPGAWGSVQRTNALAAAAAASAGASGSGLSAHSAPCTTDRAFVARLPRALALAAPRPVFTFRHHREDAAAEAAAASAPTAPPESAASGGFSALPARLTFSTATQGATLPALLHGFGGYFSAELFPGVTLSTLPSSHTPDMHSWFPLFIPLRAPCVVEPGGGIELAVWRCREAGGGRGGGRVWYEWALCAPVLQGIQNAGGKSWDMRL
jgi:protein arginine N-methyltransferase 5